MVMMSSFDYWHWFILAVILLIAEILTPTSFFVWIALSAFITGGISFVFPTLSWELLGFLFAVMSIACAYLGRRFVKFKEKPTDTPNLNCKSEQMIGKIYTVSKPVANGLGKVKVGDSEWLAESSQDIAVGEKVIVEKVDSTTLIVQKVV